MKKIYNLISVFLVLTSISVLAQNQWNYYGVTPNYTYLNGEVPNFSNENPVPSFEKNKFYPELGGWVIQTTNNGQTGLVITNQYIGPNQGEGPLTDIASILKDKKNYGEHSRKFSDWRLPDFGEYKIITENPPEFLRKTYHWTIWNYPEGYNFNGSINGETSAYASLEYYCKQIPSGAPFYVANMPSDSSGNFGVGDAGKIFKSGGYACPEIFDTKINDLRQSAMLLNPKGNLMILGIRSFDFSQIP